MATGVPFLDGMLAGQQYKRQQQQDALLQLQLKRQDDEYNRAQQSRGALGDIVAGGGNPDPAKLANLARTDPETYIKYQQFRSGQQDAEWKRKREASQFAVDAMGMIESLPPDQRPAAWAMARQQAQAQGYDIAGIPEQYDPTAARMIAMRNQNFLKWSENQIGTAPGGVMGGWNAGGATPPASGGAPAGGTSPKPVAPFNVPQDAGSYFGGALNFTEQKYGLPPGLLAKVAGVESRYDPNAVSAKGAIGVMQLMPDTARTLGVDDPRNPVKNIDAGARFLKQNLDRYNGDQVLALMAYNWGPGNVDKWIAGGRNPAQVPAETKSYIQQITGGNPFGGNVVAAAPGSVPDLPQGGQNTPPAGGANAGLMPLFKGTRPYTDGLQPGFQWARDAAGKLVQMRIPGGKPNTREVTLDDGVWLVDNDTGQKVTRVGDRPSDKQIPAGYMRDPNNPNQLVFVPGGPADPEQAGKLADAKRRENLKAVPQAVFNAYTQNSTNIKKIDSVIGNMRPGPNGRVDLTGVGGWPGWIAANIPGGAWAENSWLNPDGSVNRALIADIGSLKIHDRSGAAVTASEFPRLAPFIPSPSDNPKVVYEKLINFRREYLNLMQETQDYYSEANGYKPIANAADLINTAEPKPGDKGAGFGPVSTVPTKPPANGGSGDVPINGKSNAPADLPPGAKPVGTYQGKPVIEMPDGKRYVVQ